MKQYLMNRKKKKTRQCIRQTKLVINLLRPQQLKDDLGRIASSVLTQSIVFVMRGVLRVCSQSSPMFHRHSWEPQPVSSVLRDKSTGKRQTKLERDRGEERRHGRWERKGKEETGGDLKLTIAKRKDYSPFSALKRAISSCPAFNWLWRVWWLWLWWRENRRQRCKGTMP